MVLATALTLASVGSQLAGSAMSFAEARKQKRLQAKAEKEADIAMASARKSLEKNYMDSLAIQKEPYELERDAALVAGAQATEALRESDRGMGRVGAIYGQQQQAQRQIASAMGQEMFNLDYLSAQEDTRLRDIGTQLDLGEVTGAQLAAANAEERRAQQLQAGVAGIGGAAMTGLDALALYGKTKSPTEAKIDTTSLRKVGDTPLDRLDAMNSYDPTGSFTSSIEDLARQRREIDPSSFTTREYDPTRAFTSSVADLARQRREINPLLLSPRGGFGSNYMRGTNPTNPFSYLGY